MARIIRIRPVQSDEADEGTRQIFSGMLVHILAQLRPCEGSANEEDNEHQVAYHGRRSTRISYGVDSCRAKGISHSGMAFIFWTLGQMSHWKASAWSRHFPCKDIPASFWLTDMSMLAEGARALRAESC